jgi:hypothetical protein
MLESVMESKEWMIRPDGTIVEAAIKAYNELEKNLRNLPKHGTDAFLKESLMSFIKMLKSA